MLLNWIIYSNTIKSIHITIHKLLILYIFRDLFKCMLTNVIVFFLFCERNYKLIVDLDIQSNIASWHSLEYREEQISTFQWETQKMIHLTYAYLNSDEPFGMKSLFLKFRRFEQRLEVWTKWFRLSNGRHVTDTADMWAPITK